MAREIFWYDFGEMLYRSYYLDAYKRRTKRIDRLMSVIIALVSSSSIASWTLWGKYPFLWACLTMASQILSLMKPYFHFTQLITYIDLCVPELDELIKDMENTWRTIDQMSENDILSSCNEFSKRYLKLDAKYLNTLDMPISKRCQETAMVQRDRYLSNYLEAAKGRTTV